MSSFEKHTSEYMAQALRRPAAALVSKTPQVLGFKKSKTTTKPIEEAPERHQSATRRDERTTPANNAVIVPPKKKPMVPATPTVAQQQGPTPMLNIEKRQRQENTKATFEKLMNFSLSTELT